MKDDKSNKNAYNSEYNNKIEISNDIYMKPKWGLENINIMSITDEINIKKNEDLEINYCIKTFLENKNINIFILILLPLIIISEEFYREPLFNYSLKFEKNIQNSTSENAIIFFRFITVVGCDYFIAISLVIIFLGFSFIQTIVYFFGITLSIYMQSLMKIIYGDSRPFMERQELFKGICDGGFGNPSGHALVSFFIYLVLIHYIMNHKFFNEKIIIKILLISILVTLLLLVVFSRIILGIHSINQIIFGSLLGIWIFLILVYSFKLDRMSMIIYRKLYERKKYIFSISLLLFLSLLTPIILCSTFNHQLDYVDLNNKLNDNCQKVKKFRRFNYEGLFGCLIMVSFTGIYYGQLLFWYYLDKNYKINIDKLNNDYFLIDELINTWNKNKCYFFQKKNIIKLIQLFFICGSPLIIFFLISSENDSMLIIFVFKFSIPLFLISFLLSGIGFYWFLLMYCGNKESLLNNYYQLNIDDI